MDLWQVAVGLGPLLGVVIGASLGGRNDAKKWRRDWLISQLTRRMEYFLRVTSALDGQALILGVSADAALGKREPVARDRVEAATLQWREVLSARYISAGDKLQHAIADFDQARAAGVEAINAKEPRTIALTLERLKDSRLEVLDALQLELNEMNRALAPHVLDGWRRVLARLTRQSLVPEASPPSTRQRPDSTRPA